MKADQIERVRLPEGLLMALQKAIATASAEPEVYLALELEKTYMMAGLRQGELYLLEASGLIQKQDFIAHAKAKPCKVSSLGSAVFVLRHWLGGRGGRLPSHLG